VSHLELSGPAGAAADRAARPVVEVPPLVVGGLVVSKAALVETLGGLVPGLRDLVATEDGRHFWLILEEGACDARATASS
jgi:hypothetical protein